MPRVLVIHWNEQERDDRVARLTTAGFDAEPLDLSPGSVALKAVRAAPPDAFVIDLGRLPSHGREVALTLRQSKTTRNVPLIFVDGAVEKVERIRELLPDATYTDWKKIKGDLNRAVKNLPTAPIIPRTTMDAYAKAPLAKKLGLAADMKVGLVDAPPKWEQTIAALPKNVRWSRRPRAICDMVVWFVRSMSDLEERIDKIESLVGSRGLWIAWPKKTSKIESDVSEPHVRRIAMAAGWVDYKVCSIDETWSALRFSRRKS